MKESGLSSISGVNGSGNNILNYPVGLLTADEVSLAGGKVGESNSDYYLYTGQIYWLGSPYAYYTDYDGANVETINLYGELVSGGGGITSNYGVRPVINLKSSVEYASGSGTEDDPYVVKEIPTANISLNTTENTIGLGNTATFSVTVDSGVESSIPGVLTVRSENTNVATVSPSNANVTATPSGVSTIITVSGIFGGVSKINVIFTPTDTTTYGVSSKVYTITVNPCESGDTLADCLIYADYGDRNYSASITNINNKTASDFSTTSIVDEGLKATSDYSSISSTSLDGTSYYYRGAVEDNWVSFAGYLWRVVRINGDGSVRMIYSGTSNSHTGTDAQIGLSVYNSLSNRAKYVGYMYDTDKDSVVKEVIDTWYENNLRTGYEDYLSNEIFCNDRSYATRSGYSNLYYGSYVRLNTYKNPTLECTNRADRFSLKVSGAGCVPGVSGAGNNQLNYPIGLLTADEVSFAGGADDYARNTKFFLYTGESYWLGSPYYSSSSYATVLTEYSDYSLMYEGVSYNYGVRPVINLKSSVKYKGGTGSENNPYEIEQKPSISLNVTKGSVSPSDTITFTATVYSGDVASIPGTLTVSSSDTSKATVSPATSSITATPGGTSVTITVTGIALGSSTITVGFTPTNTSTYSTPEPKTYSVTTRNEYTVTFNANGGEFSDSSTTNTLVYPVDYLTITETTVTKYSHTSNVDDTGLQTSNYGNNWTNANITGTDRGDTSKAHVVTIPGATSLTVDIYYNGQGTSYDWVTIWEGSHPEYTATSNYSLGVTNGQRLGGSWSGSYTVNGNSLTNVGHSTLTIDGDTVTFGFKSNASNVGQGYGYYAIITNNGPLENVSYTGTYSEPTKSGYDFIGWLSSEDSNLYDNLNEKKLRPTDDITYTAQWGHYVAVPTASSYCLSGLSYTGNSQTITSTPATGYNFSGNIATNAGNHLVTAILDTDYVWEDNTWENKSIICTINKITPTLSLSTTSGSVVEGNTTTLTVSLMNSVNSEGILSVISSDTSVATITPVNTNITATPSGVSSTETITGIAKGYSTMTISFKPTDTTNFNAPNEMTYRLFVAGINQCESGDTLADCLVYNDYGDRNYNNAITNINNKDQSDFYLASTTYEGLKAISDYSSVSSSTLDGTSYYYRGKIEDNWVSFAGYLWRIVRINGDGSVRMIYSGTGSNHTGTGTQISTSAYSSLTNDPKYIGYTYDVDTDSTIKGVIDSWYINNLKESYEGYLANEIFCNDKNISSTSGNYTYLGAYDRLANYNVGVYSPTLFCTNQSDMYTLKVSGLSNISGINGAGNNLLTYPIGLLTADELSIAGGSYNYRNTDFYLYTGQSYFLGSPYYYYSSGDYMFSISTNGYISSANVTSNYGVRPIINLKSSIEYYSGSGTESDPYVVKELHTPTITLSSTEGTVVPGSTTTFTVTVSSGGAYTIPGTLNVRSLNPEKATVSPTSTNITATQSGVSTTITVTSVEPGSSRIEIAFIPADANSGGISSRTYIATVAPCAQGDTLANCLIYADSLTRNYSNAIATINNKSARDFNSLATSDEGLHAIADYSSITSTSLEGTSYYFRGAVPDNWVSFAGYYWRVIRINGDGSIRLIYSGTSSNHTGEDTQIGTSVYNNSKDPSKYIGYTYDTNIDSTIKGIIDTWYENNLKSKYETYISNEIFCNDRSVGSTSGNYTYYGAYTRLYNNKTPSLACSNQADRYSLKLLGASYIQGTSDGGNNQLVYPVGLLTADEVALAGGRSGNSNTSYYLTTGQTYWLGTPNSFNAANNSRTSYVYVINTSGTLTYASVLSTYGVRPVINLNSTVQYYSGSGTESDPYVVRELPTPTVTLNSTEATILSSDTTTFTVTVTSDNTSNIPGTLLVRVDDTDIASVNPVSSNITATPGGTSTTITVTGLGKGTSKIGVFFIPTDTTTYGVSSTFYSITVYLCESGDNLSDCLIYEDYNRRDYGNAITAINNKAAIDFSTVATTDEGLHAKQDYSSLNSTLLDGTSYYYRGAVPDNWVSFGGFYWRIVRINGDGSIRMIYSGTSSNHSGTGTAIGSSAYNSTAITGYTYTDVVEVDSNIKGIIDTWYESNLKDYYEGYLSNEIFCNDRSGSYTLPPKLGCTNKADRYTLKEVGPSSIPGEKGVGNNRLNYPIGLLTVEEVSLAGGTSDTDNSYYYLYNTGFAMTLGTGAGQRERDIFEVKGSSSGKEYGRISGCCTANSSGRTIRPVINLRYNVKYDSGSGTSNDPYIIKQEQYISLSASKGGVSQNGTTTFTATIYSGGTSDVQGTLTVNSSDTSKATVSYSNSSITATPSGTQVLITVTGVALGSSTITVGFTPTDTINYSSAESKTYTVTTRSDYTITFDANGGTFANNNSTNILQYPVNYLTTTSTSVTKYSHTSNVDDTGLKISNYGNNWTNANITGTDRGDTSKAHVVTIPGASSLTVDIYYNGQSFLDTYGSFVSLSSTDWATVWEGRYPDYTVSSNYLFGLSGGTMLGDSQSGSYTVNGNSLTNMGHKTFTINGDTVTFGFKSSSSGVGDGYGYYAIITNNGQRELVTYNGTYSTPTRDGYDFVGWLSSEDGLLYKTVNIDLLRPSDDVTYTAQWKHYVTIPTASVYCQSGLTYTGDTQTLTSTPAIGYSFTGNSQTNAGTYTITATLDQDYLWTDDTNENRTFKCSIGKATPAITLSSSSGYVVVGSSSTFTATVTSGASNSTVSGTISVTNSNTSIATVSPTSSDITATSAGIATTETLTGVSRGGNTITISFTPSDTTNFNSSSNVTYTNFVTGVNNCEAGDTLGNCLIYNDYGSRNYSDAVTAINNKASSDFSSISTTYEGLKAIADYSSISSTTLDGISYYYRGDVRDNWVNFAGFLWRVVRINGDGSIRMIFSGTTSGHTGIGTQLSSTMRYNNHYTDSSDIKYMYDINTDSTIKSSIDDWYVNNLKTNYENYLANEIFCNDTRINNTSGNTTYYDAYDRLYTNKTPSLQCTNQSDMYTLKVSGNSSIAGVSGAGNNMLDYPIGLLTADEVSLAGGKSGSSNSNYYLYNGAQTCWLSSAYRYNSSAYVFTISQYGDLSGTYVGGNYGLRPVINLKSTVKYDSGRGTENDPYVIVPTPIITLSASSGDVSEEATSHFTATVASDGLSNIEGTLTISSSDTTKATVTPTSSSITATPAGVSTDIAIEGVASGNSTITVSFTPTNTTIYSSAQPKTYTVTVSNPCTSGDTFADCLVYADYGSRNYSNAVSAISNKSAADFSNISTVDDGLHAIEDYSSVSATTLDGTSYYYRGAVVDNWVSFAGYLWRIVRINGDGSVRMIYSGTTANHTGTGTQIGTSSYNSVDFGLEKYIGYMYDTSTNSTIKTSIDNWYVSNLKTNYESYLSNEIFCNDRNRASSDVSYYYYGTYNRLFSNKVPSLQCVQQSDRFTLKESGPSSISGMAGAGNNKLDYPIGLLTADEASLAGNVYNINNNSSYLYTGQNYWTSSPELYGGTRTKYAYGFTVSVNGAIYNGSMANTYGIRPVINLSTSVLYNSGSGTESDPYTVKL